MWHVDSDLESSGIDDGTGIDASDPSDAWRDRAACKGRTHLFFARLAERPEARERREAKAALLCAGCVVFEACRAYARANHEYGFWAGESEEQRHRLGFTVSAPVGLRAHTGRVG